MASEERAKVAAQSPSRTPHLPVLADQVVSLLVPSPSTGGLYLDATVGAGGHSRALLEAAGPRARVVAFDRDERALAVATEELREFGERVELVHSDFREAPAHLRGLILDGAVADLGVSSLQLDDPEAGFSFRLPGPLDMRMDRRRRTTAADIVNGLPEDELAHLLWEYGEEKASRRIAAAIVSARRRSPIGRTEELAEIVRGAVGRGRGRTDPSTRTFQALRIAVNDELSGLDRFLVEVVNQLRPGGRLAVISFHSLEDRIVKRTLRRLAGRPINLTGEPAPAAAEPKVKLLTRKPLRPSRAEMEANRRCRSARLRAAEKLDPEERP